MPTEWTTLVDVGALRANLGRRDLVVVDCRHRLDDPAWGERVYKEGHIPGAFFAHVDRDLSSPITPATGRHPLPDPARFRALASGWGVGPDTQVVAYDDAGGPYASRLWWLLGHYGHDRVAVLDGGLGAWREEDGPLARDAPRRKPTEFLGAPGHRPTVDAASIARRLPVAPGALLDARDAVRYRGEVEPIDPVAGHIPGATSAPFKENLGPDGRFLDADELFGRYERLLAGRSPDQVAVYCGSGVTAAHLLLAMSAAGLPGAALYPGSWSEWIRDPKRQVTRGAAP